MPPLTSLTASFHKIISQGPTPRGPSLRSAPTTPGGYTTLEFEPTVNLLRTADQHLEFETLTYNVVGLSHVVLRKHRLVNAGWLLTACSILAMIAASLSIFLRG